MMIRCFKLSWSIFLPTEVHSIVHNITGPKHSLFHHAFQNQNSQSSAFAAPVYSIQSLDSGKVVATSEIYLQTHESLSDDTASAQHTFEETIHVTLLQQDFTSPRSWLTGASPGPASEPRSLRTWQTLTFLVEKVGAEASQQEQNRSLTDSRRHRDVWDETLQIEDFDDRGISFSRDHTFVAVDREDWNRATHAKAPIRKLLHNIDQIIHLMASFEPARDPASVGDPIHR